MKENKVDNKPKEYKDIVKYYSTIRLTSIMRTDSIFINDVLMQLRKMLQRHRDIITILDNRLFRTEGDKRCRRLTDED